MDGGGGGAAAADGGKQQISTTEAKLRYIRLLSESIKTFGTATFMATLVLSSPVCIPMCPLVRLAR